MSAEALNPCCCNDNKYSRVPLPVQVRTYSLTLQGLRIQKSATIYDPKGSGSAELSIFKHCICVRIIVDFEMILFIKECIFWQII